MKINTKQTINSLNGEIIKTEEGDFTVGYALSNILIDAKEGGRMKLFVLAQKFYTEKEVDVDEADLQIIKNAVERTELFNNLINGQLLVTLNENNSKTS